MITKHWMAGLAIVAAAATFVGSVHAATPLKRVTVKGELLDMACYTTMGMRGRAHGKTCGKKCLQSGLPAGILVRGVAWTLLTNPRMLAADVGREIKVTGKADAVDHVIMPTHIWWKMGGMWMAIKLKDYLHH